MHPTLTTINDRLKNVITQVQATVPSDEPFGNAHANWSFPGLTKAELIEEAQSIYDLIESEGGNELNDQEARLNDYIRRLEFLVQHTIPQLWGSAAAAVPAYFFTLQGLRKALAPVLASDDHAEAVKKLKKLTTQLRSMEARLNGLEPRTVSLGTMVERIEQAHNAADQLPTDLESLTEARGKIASLLADATKERTELIKMHESAERIDLELIASANEAKAVLKRCETAYSAATSVGLAAAFSERSVSLSKSMWFWVSGLVVALAAGSYFGSGRLSALSELLKVPNASTAVIVLNFLLSVLSVSAPVWFAWLATKQIGQRFKLSEDYAFKASVSRAYEGFRREAARFDKNMEGKLLTSALSRFDELPLRVIETDGHGSPWHELLSSDVVKQAIKAVPGFAEQVKDLADKAIARSSFKAEPKSKPDVSNE